MWEIIKNIFDQQSKVVIILPVLAGVGVFVADFARAGQLRGEAVTLFGLVVAAATVNRVFSRVHSKDGAARVKGPGGFEVEICTNGQPLTETQRGIYDGHYNE